MFRFTHKNWQKISANEESDVVCEFCQSDASFESAELGVCIVSRGASEGRMEVFCEIDSIAHTNIHKELL